MHPNQKMTDFNYKKYSLEKLEEWMHDAMSNGETTPQEVYDTIKKVVDENYHYHKHHASQAYELLALLNGNGKGHIKAYDDYICTDSKGNDLSDVDGLYMTQFYCDSNDSSEQCKGSWNDFWEDDVIKEDKVVKWQLPVEQDLGSDDYYITFPDDLLEAADLKEGDTVEWVDNNNGTYILRKTNAK